jgi:hypothetical protein
MSIQAKGEHACQIAGFSPPGCHSSDLTINLIDDKVMMMTEDDFFVDDTYMETCGNNNFQKPIFAFQ